ncbi:MAG: hypothetical protein S0880_07430 [Actinomycetota bacterium]|nr:hypothetical protein [Actinomycetota bacterium]
MASTLTNEALYRMALGELDWEDDTIVLLLLDTASADVDTAAWSEVSADECSGTGYAAKTLANVSVTKDDAGNRVVVDADDPSTYASADFGTIAQGVIIRQAGGSPAGTDFVLAVMGSDDFSLTTNTGDVDLAFAAGGIGTITNS